MKASTDSVPSDNSSPSWPVPVAHLGVDEGDRDVSVVGDHREPVPELGEPQHHVGVAWGGVAWGVGGRCPLRQTLANNKLAFFWTISR